MAILRKQYVQVEKKEYGYIMFNGHIILDPCDPARRRSTRRRNLGRTYPVVTNPTTKPTTNAVAQGDRVSCTHNWSRRHANVAIWLCTRIRTLDLYCYGHNSKALLGTGYKVTYTMNSRMD